MGSYMDGFMVGSILGDNSAQTVQALDERNEALDERDAALNQVQKLSSALEKEHARFLIERRERKSYMRGWNLRGLILKNNCGYSPERIDAEENVIEAEGAYEARLVEVSRERDNEINREAGFPDAHG